MPLLLSLLLLLAHTPRSLAMKIMVHLSLFLLRMDHSPLSLVLKALFLLSPFRLLIQSTPVMMLKLNRTHRSRPLPRLLLLPTMVKLPITVTLPITVMSPRMEMLPTMARSPGPIRVVMRMRNIPLFPSPLLVLPRPRR